MPTAPFSKSLSPGRETVFTLEFNSIETSLGKRFEEVAACYPLHVALSHGGLAMSYERLERLTRAIASHLPVAASPESGVVGVLMPACTLHVAAVLGVLRGARPYLSLDPAFPFVRLQMMRECAGAGVILSTAEFASLAARLGGAVVIIDAEMEEAGDLTAKTLPDAGPESFACLYFTSGSTGEPKAIVHTHRNVLFDIRRQTRDMGVTPEDRFDLLFSPSFSAFLSPVFGALLTGASVHLFDLKSRGVEALRDWLTAEAISLSTMSVSTFRRLAGVLAPEPGLLSVRMLSLGAEPLVTHDIALFQLHFGTRCVLQNAFATTETRTITQCYMRADEALPAEISIGFAVDGKDLTLRDEAGERVPEGECGEMLIESLYISPGLWSELKTLEGNRLPAPRRTLHRTGDLARQLPDGRLLHLGRKDHQIKLRGHRIEAAEIENALLRHPGILNAAVFLWEDQEAGMGLAALLVARDAMEVAVSEVRGFLCGMLPEYLVPAYYGWVESLPLTLTGKLDRGRLGPAFAGTLPQAAAAAHASRAGLNAAVSAAIDPILAAMRQVLSRPTLGLDDDFFASGGDSLSAVELMGEVERLTQKRLSPSLLMAASSARRLRERCQREGAEEDGTIQRVLLQAGSGGVPLYLIPPWNHGSVMVRDLAGCEGGSGALFSLEGFDPGADTPAASLQEIAARHVRRLLRWHPEGTFAIGGFSMGGFLAWEIAQQLSSLGRAPERIYMVDCPRLYSARSAADELWVAQTSRPLGRLFTLLQCLWRPGKLRRWPILRRTVLGKFEWLLRGRYRVRPVNPFEDAFQANVLLSEAYRVQPCKVPVTLIRAGIQTDWKNLFLWDLGWSASCEGGLDIFEIDSLHLELLHVPHVQILSGLLAGRAG